MASKWLKKARRRAQENLLQKLGAHSRDEDPEFGKAQERFVAITESVAEVYAALRTHLQTVLAVSEAQETIAVALERVGDVSFAGESGAGVMEYVDQLRELSSRMVPAYQRTYVDMVLTPCSALLERAPAIQEKIKERNRLHLDLDSYRSRMRNAKGSMKMAQDDMRDTRQQKLDRAEVKVAELNQEIIYAIRYLEVDTSHAISEAVAAAIACQVQWHDDHAMAFEDMMPSFPMSAVATCKLCERLEKVPGVVKNSRMRQSAASQSSTFSLSTSMDFSSVSPRANPRAFSWDNGIALLEPSISGLRHSESAPGPRIGPIHRGSSPPAPSSSPSARSAGDRHSWSRPSERRPRNPLLSSASIDGSLSPLPDRFGPGRENPLRSVLMSQNSFDLAKSPSAGSSPEEGTIETAFPDVASDTSQQRDPSGPIDLGEEAVVEYVRVLHPYQKQEDGDIDLRPGNIIAVRRKTESGWWFGVCNGEEGLFPSNYTMPM